MQRENPSIITTVRSVLEKNPWYETRWKSQLNKLPEDERDEMLFMLAARWADDIRAGQSREPSAMALRRLSVQARRWAGIRQTIATKSGWYRENAGREQLEDRAVSSFYNLFSELQRKQSRP